MVNTFCKGCGDYSHEHIKSLYNEVSSKIAKLSSKNLDNLKYKLGESDKYNQTILISFLFLLDRIVHCDNCTVHTDIEDIVSQVKNLLNK